VNRKSDVLVSIFELELEDERGPGEYGGLSQSSISSIRSHMIQRKKERRTPKTFRYFIYTPRPYSLTLKLSK